MQGINDCQHFSVASCYLVMVETLKQANLPNGIIMFK
jgi:hypothetical protein